MLMKVSHGDVVRGLLNNSTAASLGKAAILSAVTLVGKTDVLHIRSIGRTTRTIGVMRTVGRNEM